MKTPIDPSRALVTDLLLVRLDGTEVPLTIRIGYPSARDTHWACPCEIEGLEDPYPDIGGSDPLQAMSLALNLVRARLKSTLAKGHRLCLPDDRMPLTARLIDAWFGVK